MAEVLIVFIVALPPLFAVIAAAYMALNGHEHWVWFLIAAVLMAGALARRVL